MAPIMKPLVYGFFLFKKQRLLILACVQVDLVVSRIFMMLPECGWKVIEPLRTNASFNDTRNAIGSETICVFRAKSLFQGP
jgi:hypothetical protein